MSKRSSPRFTKRFARAFFLGCTMKLVMDFMPAASSSGSSSLQYSIKLSSFIGMERHADRGEHFRGER